MSEELSQCLTEDLIAELQRRFDASVVSGYQIRTNARAIFVVRWLGNPALCATIAGQAQHDIFHSIGMSSEEKGGGSSL